MMAFRRYASDIVADDERLRCQTSSSVDIRYSVLSNASKSDNAGVLHLQYICSKKIAILNTTARPLWLVVFSSSFRLM